MFKITKQYRGFPAAHRQPKHDGHCRFIHGHDWGFDIVLTCVKMDRNGFVYDVGRLQKVKEFLTKTFDHTCLINADDPHLSEFRRMESDGLLDLRVVHNCGMEALARLVYEAVTNILESDQDCRARAVRLVEVTCWEDMKNSATYAAL